MKGLLHIGDEASTFFVLSVDPHSSVAWDRRGCLVRFEVCFLNEQNVQVQVSGLSSELRDLISEPIGIPLKDPEFVVGNFRLWEGVSRDISSSTVDGLVILIETHFWHDQMRSPFW